MCRPRRGAGMPPHSDLLWPVPCEARASIGNDGIGSAPTPVKSPLVRIFMGRPTQRNYAVEGPAPYDVLRACDDGPKPSSVSARWRAPRHPGFAPSVNRPQWKSHCGFAYPTRAILGGDHTTLLVCLTYSRFTRPLARLITSCIQSGKPCRSKSEAVGDRQCSTGSRRSKS
jgi:hypothetical protein